MAKMTYDEKVDKLFELMQDDEEEWKRMKEEYEEYGIEVIEFQASEICYKGSGGPTCLTRPLFRI
jgi:arginine deiminase